MANNTQINECGMTWAQRAYYHELINEGFNNYDAYNESMTLTRD